MQIVNRSNFPSGSDSKESACNAGDLGSIPGLEGSPGKGTGILTPVFLPGESHGQRSLAGYGPRGGTESDMTEATQHGCKTDGYLLW